MEQGVYYFKVTLALLYNEWTKWDEMPYMCMNNFLAENKTR